MPPVRIRAPELRGAGGWIGVEHLSLATLRGRVVLLDFFTQACVNCQHVVEELRGLERRFAGELVVVGIHSPKFPREAEHASVEAAVARMRIEHPVLDDPDSRTWAQYAIRAWPTLVVLDATGREAFRTSGEGHAVELARVVEELVAEAREAGILRTGPLELDRAAHGTGELAFPGKVAAAAAGPPRFAVADTGHDRVLVCAPDGEVLAEHPGLYAPQGVHWDGEDLLVCETGAHRVWRLAAGAGTRVLVAEGLWSPWDVVVWRGHVVIAEAGRHRLWVVDRAGDPQLLAGLGPEELRDGPALEALLAQPSGLAVTPADELAWVDAESSALRLLDRPGGTVRTLVGYDLFAWGDADGPGDRARLQHPLGVAAAADGALYVADTFNGLVRVWRGSHLWTVPVEGFAEPGGLDVEPGAGTLLVADTGNHRIVRVDPVAGVAVAVDVGRPGSRDDRGAPGVAETVVAEPGGTLAVQLDVPLGGDALDPMGGAPVRVVARATDPALLDAPAGEASWELDALPARVDVPLGPAPASGRITVELRVASCGPDACRLRRAERAYDVVLARGGGV
jgi:thiol-disulfide isomerase/thioredoxin/DNA-binding beta-propeller fold protein YncE